MDLYPHRESGVWARVKNHLRARAALAITNLIVLAVAAGLVLLVFLIGVVCYVVL